MKVTNALLEQSDLLQADERHRQALESLYDVVDPELGINIMDLGLVYGLEVEDAGARVEMTMTTPACPLHSYLSSMVEEALVRAVPGVKSVDVRLVWDPPWGPEMMSGAAKRALGW